MEISLNESKNYKVIKLSGRLDAHTVSKLEDFISKNLNDSDNRIAFDLSGLSLITSAGMRVLIILQQKSEKFYVIVRELNETDNIYKVLSICGLEMTMDIISSEADMK